MITKLLVISFTLILASLSFANSPSIVGDWISKPEKKNGVTYTLDLAIEQNQTEFGLECEFKEVSMHTTQTVQTRIEGDNYMILGSAISEGACPLTITPAKIKFEASSSELQLIYPDGKKVTFTRVN